MFRFLKIESFKLFYKLKSWLGPMLIMILVLTAFPLSIDISQFDLEKFYFSIIVVSLLMTSFLATEGMFEEDFEDGDGGWQSNGWVRFDNILPQSWLIQLVNSQTKEVTTIKVQDGKAEFEIDVGITIVVAATTPYTTELSSYHIETY